MTTALTPDLANTLAPDYGFAEPAAASLTSSRIILARHGKPALSRDVWLTAGQYRDWWATYDTVGLDPVLPVPDRIRDMARAADVVISSSLPRAHETAKAALGDLPHHVLDTLVEAPLPPPGLGPIRMKPIAWGTLSRILWMMGRAQGGESAGQARLRAKAAASDLSDLAQGRTVFVAAHGWFNRMLGRQLRRQGWTCVEDRGDRYWSHRTYVRPASFQ